MSPADLHSPVAEAKALARKAAHALRRTAHGDTALRGAVSSALADHLGGLQGRIVSGYLPIRTEADPLPAMERLAAANRVCVPVIEGPGRPLVFREWRPGVRLIEGPFRVMVPEDGELLVPDTLIVPLLAFDPRLFRLGYGGGFYDRTLAALRARGPVEAVGLAFSAQEAPSIPLEPTDLPLDVLVTEKGARRAK